MFDDDTTRKFNFFYDTTKTYSGGIVQELRNTVLLSLFTASFRVGGNQLIFEIISIMYVCFVYVGVYNNVCATSTI